MYKEMKYKKTIPCIGQGGMIVQLLELDGAELQVIYDCGTKSAKGNIKVEISKLRKDIDSVLIISHLDSDHYNAVNELIAQSIKVTKIILPESSDEERILIAATCEDDVTREFTFNPKSIFPSAVVIRVSNNDSNQEKSIISDIEDGEVVSHLKSYSFLYLSDDQPKWKVRFFVDKQMFANLSTEEKILIANSNTVDSFNVNLCDLKKIYSRISKRKINLTSMMMFIYPSVDDNHLKMLWPCHWCCCRSLIMCTGDIKVTKKICADIQKHYEIMLHFVFEFMVPHHASDSYFDENPFTFAVRCFAQTGSYKQYKHPGKLTKQYIESQGLEFYNVTFG